MRLKFRKSRLCNSQHKRAFTLLEFSVVVVVIGLVIGAVIIGQEMLGSSRLQAVVTDVEKYRRAAHDFENAYGGLPGDFYSDQTVWTELPVATAGAYGNGDGFIDEYTEGFRAWQHLALGQMIKGAYSGTATGNTAVVGINVPEASVPESGFSFISLTGTEIDTSWLFDAALSADALAGVYIAFGAQQAGDITIAGSIPVDDAIGIDSKVDDGLPDSGTVLGTMQTAGRCTEFDPATVAPNQRVRYDVEDEGNVCNLYFVLNNE
jgi:prepilin-type N-terminal cleavage/methylation domain-containing protein